MGGTAVLFVLVYCSTQVAAYGRNPHWDNNISVEGVSVPLGGVSFLEVSKDLNVTSEDKDELIDVYQDWLRVVLESMHGPDWEEAFAPYGPVGRCADNFHFVHQGCQMLFYTCSQTPDEQYWMCRSSFLRSCTCSAGDTGVFSWLVPSLRKCHGNIVTDAELLATLSQTIVDADDVEEIFFSLGECRVSIMFLTWLLIPFFLLGFIIRKGLK
eukprot:Lankesteria_metandrocarpae@DN7371_c0_g1_i1.p1